MTDEIVVINFLLSQSSENDTVGSLIVAKQNCGERLIGRTSDSGMYHTGIGPAVARCIVKFGIFGIFGCTDMVDRESHAFIDAGIFVVIKEIFIGIAAGFDIGEKAGKFHKFDCRTVVFEDAFNTDFAVVNSQIETVSKRFIIETVDLVIFT